MTSANLSDTEAALRAALIARGLEIRESVEDAVNEYERQCADRGRIAQEAARKPELQESLNARRDAEEAVREVERRRSDASDRLKSTAAQLGLRSGTNEELTSRLEAWQQARRQSIRVRETGLKEWQELEDILQGRTLKDLEVNTGQRRERAHKLAAGISPGELDGVALDDDVDRQLDELKRAENRKRRARDEMRGTMEQVESTLPSVPEAEEELVRAEEELNRLRTLDRILQKTTESVERAQDRVHRTLAPVLRNAVSSWLPAITQGRYTDVRVDVESLLVQVKNPQGRWRDAPLLSHGTAEQVYLLLRVALAKHLTKKGEICPLILDDVTVQCDPDRKVAVLNLLHQFSGERQIILFSQERGVLEWAQAHLAGQDDQLIELPGPADAPA